MKRLSLLILVISLFGFAGCGKAANSNNAVSNNSSVSTVSNKTTEIDSPKVSNSLSQDNSLDTITDISNWTHPVKYVFKNANIEVSKVEFKNNKTYPIFYVKLVKGLNSDNKVYYKNLIKQIAAANGNWDYEIIDASKDVDIKVTCDRSKHIVTQIEYNKDSKYFEDSTETDHAISDTELVNYLISNVKEVNSFVQTMNNNKSGAKSIVYVERYPDSNSSDEHLKNYYGLYVGESYPDHNVNIYRFAINKDTKEILYYDVVNDKYMSLDDWRKNK